MAAERGKPGWRPGASAAALLYLLLAVVLLAPFSLQLADHVLGRGDSLLNVWILSWVSRALWVDPASLYHGNAMYPFPYSIAFSDVQLASVPFFAPVFLVTGNPVFAHNLLVLASFVLSGLGAFWLGRALTGSAAAGLVAGMVFGFAPYRFVHLVHVQLLTTHWIPVAFLALHVARRDPRWRYFVAFSACLVLQALSSFYNGLFLAVGVASFVGYLGVRRQLDRGFVRRLVVASLLTVIVLVPFVAPYFAARRLYGFARDLRTAQVFSATPSDYAYTHPHSVLYGHWLGRPRPQKTPENMIFTGFVAPALAVFGLAARRRRAPGAQPEVEDGPLLALLAVAVLLSLGPWLSLPADAGRLPMPYILLHHSIPGFQGLRVPARFVVLVTLALGVLAGRGAAQLAGWATRRRGRVAGALLVAAVVTVLALECAIFPVKGEAVEVRDGVPRVYRWLAEQPAGTPVVDLPFEGSRTWEVMYFSTYHWQPIVNGSSGFQPPGSRWLGRACRKLPSDWAVERLLDTGVQLVVLRLAAYPPDRRADVVRSFDSSRRVRLVASFDTDRVYRLLPP
jgi:hypothetical protein